MIPDPLCAFDLAPRGGLLAIRLLVVWALKIGNWVCHQRSPRLALGPLQTPERNGSAKGSVR